MHRIRESILQKTEITLHEVEKSLFLNPNSGEEDDDTGSSPPSCGRGSSPRRHPSSLTSDGYIEFLRGDGSQDPKLVQSTAHVTSTEKKKENMIGGDWRRLASSAGSAEDSPQSPREDAYQFIADLRVMTLQADLFLQRQKSLHQSLRVELAALEMNDDARSTSKGNRQIKLE